jgi:hypothetical protein
MTLAIHKMIKHLACYKPRNKKEMAAIWEELIFLDKETGHGGRSRKRKGYACTPSSNLPTNSDSKSYLQSSGAYMTSPYTDASSPRQTPKGAATTQSEQYYTSLSATHKETA